MKISQEPSKHYTLSIGTRVYTLPRIHPSEKLTNIVQNSYNATFHKISSNPEQTAAEINGWVREITNNKISQLVEANAIRSSVVMLLNAIYFKGLWKHPFNNTVDMFFNNGNGEPVRRQFVQQVNNFNYAYDPDRQLRIVQLPYEGKKFSMFIVLPFDNDGLEKVISKLSSKGFDEIFQDMEDISVNITLPKFRFDSKVNLNDVVKEVRELESQNI